MKKKVNGRPKPASICYVTIDLSNLVHPISKSLSLGTSKLQECDDYVVNSMCIVFICWC